jgi:hypothetical protein
MLASVAWPLQEKLNPILSAKFGLPNLLLDTGGLSPSILNGGLTDGKIPGILVLFTVLASMLEMQGMVLRKENDDLLPGDYNWRTTFAKDDSDAFSSLQEGEIWNSRIAMIAILAYVVQEVVTRVPVSDTIPWW